MISNAVEMLCKLNNAVESSLDGGKFDSTIPLNSRVFQLVKID